MTVPGGFFITARVPKMDSTKTPTTKFPFHSKFEFSRGRTINSSWSRKLPATPVTSKARFREKQSQKIAHRTDAA